MSAEDILKDAENTPPRSQVVNDESPQIIAVKYDKLGMLKSLVNEGLDIEKKSPGGESLLHYASLHGSTKCMEYLLQKGMNVNVINPNNGKTPLFYAIEDDVLKSVRFLVSRGADLTIVDTTGNNTPLLCAAKFDSIRCLHFLARQEIDANRMDFEGNTILHLLAQYDRVKEIKYFITQGVPVDVVNDDGETFVVHLSPKKRKSMQKYLMGVMNNNIIDKK